MEKNEGIIYHHGIKGMHWGIRRYQNKDGSLTPAGRKRYSEYPGGSTKDRIEKHLKKQHEEFDHNLRMKTDTYYRAQHTKQPFDEKPSDQQPIWSKKTSDKEKYASSETKNDKDVSEMSDDELRKRLNRLQMEKQYDQLTKSDTTKGEEFVSDIIKTIGTLATVTGSLITIYNNYGKIQEIIQNMTNK